MVVGKGDIIITIEPSFIHVVHINVDDDDDGDDDDDVDVV